MSDFNEPTRTLAKHELVTKIISTLIGLSASFAVTYFGIKWLTNAMDPTRKEKQAAQTRAQELLKKIGVKNVKLSDYELCIATNLVNPQDVNISWEDIAGLRSVIEEIKRTVILPLEKRALFSRSTLLQPPKGVLLYGPPGCGKTMIAKATAKAAGARFINLQVSALVDKWYGESQKRAEAVFSLALKLQPTIIFIDEIDSFLRSRSSSDHEATAMIKTQFMSFWDGLITDPCCYVIIMGATNRPQDVDAAILRRMPSTFYIGLPEKNQREDLFQLILSNEDTEESLEFNKLADLTNGYSGSDIREVCRVAALTTLHEFISDDLSSEQNSSSRLRAITMSDLTEAIYKVKKSTKQVTTPFPILPDFD